MRVHNLKILNDFADAAVPADWYGGGMLVGYGKAERKETSTISKKKILYCVW